MDFNKLVKDNKNSVKNIIRLITKEDNEDLEQEVYLRVWKNSDKYKEQGSFKSWVSTIAKNISKDYLKSAYKKQRDLTDSDDVSLNLVKDKNPTPDVKLIKTQRQERIMAAVEELKPKFKQVVLMCEIYGYSYEECAKKLKCPIGTVKSRLYNAKSALAQSLKDLL